MGKESVLGLLVCSSGQIEIWPLHVLGKQVRAGEHLWGCGACDFDLCEGCRAKAEDTVTSLTQMLAMYALQGREIGCEPRYLKRSVLLLLLLKNGPFLQKVVHRRHEESSVPAESPGRECEGATDAQG